MAKNTVSTALACGLTLSLVGCVTTAPPVITTNNYNVDSKTYQATGKSERIKTIVLHYTVSDNERSIKTLTTGNVSAHYLILDKDEFDELQIKKVAQLVQDIAARYDISPKNIIGHADMAPSRKIDPGAKFPWKRLYIDYGIGAWYDEFDKQFFLNQDGFASATIPEIKQAFRKYGYQINDTDTWDKASRDVIYAFQLHFRPQQPTGNMDSETYAILQALNQKYAGKDDFY